MLISASLAVTTIGFWRAHQATTIQLLGEEERREAIQSLLDSTDYGYAILDNEGVVIEWNPALEKLSTWPKADVIGKSLLAIMPEIYAEQHAEAFKAAMADRTNHKSIRVVHCFFPARDPTKPPIPVIITVRTVMNPLTQQRFAIAHVDRESRIQELGTK